MRRMARFRPMPIASVAKRMLYPELGSSNSLACCFRASGGREPLSTAQYSTRKFISKYTVGIRILCHIVTNSLIKSTNCYLLNNAATKRWVSFLNQCLESKQLFSTETHYTIARTQLRKIMQCSPLYTKWRQTFVCANF